MLRIRKQKATLLAVGSLLVATLLAYGVNEWRQKVYVETRNTKVRHLFQKAIAMNEEYAEKLKLSLQKRNFQEAGNVLTKLGDEYLDLLNRIDMLIEEYPEFKNRKRYNEVFRKEIEGFVASAKTLLGVLASVSDADRKRPEFNKPWKRFSKIWLRF